MNGLSTGDSHQSPQLDTLEQSESPHLGLIKNCEWFIHWRQPSITSTGHIIEKYINPHLGLIKNCERDVSRINS